MIRINLLPYREKIKEEARQRQIIFISFPVVVFLLVIVILHVQMVSSIGKLEKKIQGAENELKILTKKTGDLEKFKKDREICKTKLEIIRNLERNRLDPVRFLDELTSLVPEKHIWLTTLSETGSNIKLSGIAINNSAISDFMEALERSRFISSVELVASKQTIVSGVKLKAFQLSCNRKKG